MPTEAPQESAGGKRLIIASQLPLYVEERRVYEYQPPAHPAALVSFRKFCCSIVNSTREAVAATKHTYDVGKSHLESSFQYLQSEPAAIQRAGVIGLAALTGVVVSFRKKPVTRAFYGAMLGGAGATVCYPKETVAIFHSGYTTVKEPVLRYWEQYKPGSLYTPQTTAQKPDPSYYEEASSAVDEKKQEESTPKMEEDKGMGKDEDSYMYTTRGK